MKKKKELMKLLTASLSCCVDGLAWNREFNCSNTGGLHLFVPLSGQRLCVYSCHCCQERDCTYYLWLVNNTAGLRGSK